MTEPVQDEVFRDEDWYAAEIAGRSYVNCTFMNVDLTETASQGAVFDECTFGNVRFNASRHTDSAFLRCTFRRCNLFAAEFMGCKMTGTVFQHSALRPMRVLGGDWSLVTLAGADLRGTSFQEVRMREVDLTGANCADAAFVDVDLSAAQLHGCTFTRCDLRGSDLTGLDPGNVELTDAVITPEQAVVIARALGLKVP